ncbi:putative phosphatidylcholine-sterol O-acyltransferase [Besnoitia besnoiti]|uniref:Putative phosphatidylcholine-sterol O-acyltransferase n=1 Tax=Besnoitia besnoiti TaxID=94643 RepID=A0A2A9LZ72_BESBE|nr:putative phosphatidylcholine-sterol O-acyltransferase [Besnoitia besnoiti]PFH31085.1 putative phosphatidylcholine-sterol O-acyltransferase [Besnoitia besnoiti]
MSVIHARSGRRVARSKVSLLAGLLLSSVILCGPLGTFGFKTDVPATSPFSPFRASIRASSSASEPAGSFHTSASFPPGSVDTHEPGTLKTARSSDSDSEALVRDPDSASHSAASSAAPSSVSSPSAALGKSAGDDTDGAPSASRVHGPDSAVDHALFVVPGIAGSGLFATVKNAVISACEKSPLNYLVPFRVWASLTLVLPPASHQKCWIEMMKMKVDENGQVYSSQDGVTVEVDGYGGVHAIDYLDYYMNNTYGVPASAYMHVMIRTLLSLHYAQFVTLRGVPYDWRLPPWQLDYGQLKADIEDRYAELKNRKVDLISHSLGSIVLCFFLNRVVDQAWKDKYIGSMTLVAPATGGSFKAIKSLLSGYDDATDFDIWNVIDISLFPSVLLRELLQTMGSIYALLPDPAIYGPDRVVIRVARPPKDRLPSASLPDTPAPPNALEIQPARAATAEDAATSASATAYGEMRRLDAVMTHEEVVDERSRGDRGKQLLNTFTGVPSSYAVGAEETQPPQGEANAGPQRARLPSVGGASAEAEEDAADLEVRRQAILREFELQNRLSPEQRAARQRERHRAFVEKETRRLEDALRRAQEQGLEEDVYTLSNWTSLLPADLQRRVKTAQDTMAGVVSDPGVPVRCIWSTFEQPTTDVAYYYATGSLDRHPIRIFDYGDDTVPLPSLSLCASWPSTVQTKVFSNLDHMYLFTDPEFNRYVFDTFSPAQPNASGGSADKKTQQDRVPGSSPSGLSGSVGAGGESA